MGACDPLVSAGVSRLLYAGELLGVASYFSREPPNEEALQALSLFLVLVAVALHEARHREALALRERYAAQATALGEITAAIVRVVPLSAILEQIMQRGLELIGADEGAVFLPTTVPGEDSVRACAGYKTPIGCFAPASSFLLARVLTGR